ncbi:MAG: dipeptidase [Promethearchaeota archaeon]
MVIVDGHSDYALQIYREHLKGNKNVIKEQHLPLLQRGGINVEVLTVGGDFELFPEFDARGYNTTLKVINAIQDEISNSPDLFLLIKDAQDFDKIDNHRVSFLFALEGSGSIGDNFSRFHNYYELGVRSIALTHNKKNLFADGCAVKEAKGLSEIGKDFVRELNKYGVLIDLSHISEPSFWDTIDIMMKPPIATHSNAKHLCDHARNLTDDQINAIGEREGVIGINFFSTFVDKKGKNATVDRLIDHVDHIVELVGVNHIGLGPDFLNYYIEDLKQLSDTIPKDFPKDETQPSFEVVKDVTEIPKLLELLRKRGYSDKEVRNIQGENFIRVFKEVLK